MAGSTEAAKKAAASNKRKHGSDFYNRIGKLGGSHKHPLKGFGSDHDRAVEAGRRGGLQRQKNITAKAKQELEAGKLDS